MEEHIHEELVVVESDTIGDPGAMMVHLEYALIALGAVMAPVGLGLVAPLADANTTVSLALDGGLHAHEGLIVRLAVPACWLGCLGEAMRGPSVVFKYLRSS